MDWSSFVLGALTVLALMLFAAVAYTMGKQAASPQPAAKPEARIEPDPHAVPAGAIAVVSPDTERAKAALEARQYAAGGIIGGTPPAGP